MDGKKRKGKKKKKLNEKCTSFKMVKQLPENCSFVKLQWEEELQKYVARFPNLYVTRNTQHVRLKLGLPSIREPHFRLMARCIDLQQYDRPHPHFQELISNPFRVGTHWSQYS